MWAPNKNAMLKQTVRSLNEKVHTVGSTNLVHRIACSHECCVAANEAVGHLIHVWLVAGVFVFSVLFSAQSLFQRYSCSLYHFQPSHIPPSLTSSSSLTLSAIKTIHFNMTDHKICSTTFHSPQTIHRIQWAIFSRQNELPQRKAMG